MLCDVSMFVVEGGPCSLRILADTKGCKGQSKNGYLLTFSLPITYCRVREVGSQSTVGVQQVVVI
jgi:hypothetical protein